MASSTSIEDPQSNQANPDPVPQVEQQDGEVEATDDQLCWKSSPRNNAKRAAYIDMAFSIVGAILMSFAALIVIYYIVDKEKDEVEVGVFPYIIAVLCCLLIISSMGEVFFAYLLLSATKEMTTPPEAIRKAQCWFYYSIFFTIFFAVGGLVVSLQRPFDNIWTALGINIANIFNVTGRVGFFTNVYKFIKELKAAGYSSRLETQQMSDNTMPSTSMQVQSEESRQV